ncbi:MAG: hypothetical protein JRJ38_12710 [Deltaproteobacteria bacterium]|nr:hypothetical protein [Deltaproteobacteria bacterium]
MRPNIIMKMLILGICVFFMLSFSARKTTRGGIHVAWGPESHAGPKKAGKGGPPPHAPAHGYRAKHNYRYYPSACAYFDISRKVYFYLEKDNWKISVSLPQTIQLRLGDYVTIEMDTDKPYTQFIEHKRKYPPGQLKKKKKKRPKQ